MKTNEALSDIDISILKGMLKQYLPEQNIKYNNSENTFYIEGTRETTFLGFKRIKKKEVSVGFHDLFIHMLAPAMVLSNLNKKGPYERGLDESVDFRVADLKGKLAASLSINNNIKNAFMHLLNEYVESSIPKKVVVRSSGGTALVIDMNSSIPTAEGYHIQGDMLQKIAGSDMTIPTDLIRMLTKLTI